MSLHRLLAELGRGEYRDGSSTYEGKPYQPLGVPGLSVPSQKGHIVRAEAEIVFRHLGWAVDLAYPGNDAGYKPKPPDMLIGPNPIPAGRVLDLGSNVGYYSLTAARHGAWVTAVDKDERNLDVLDLICEMDGLQVRTEESIDVALEMGTYNVTFMINLFHWIHKQRGFDGAFQLLSRIASVTERIYFQAPLTSNQSFYHVEELVQPFDVERMLWIAGFSDVQLLCCTDHHDDDHRHLFVANGTRAQ